ncbi:sel1 repeat family protein [Pseudomonas baltica]|uniref:tetratricopeptide repeat protein n=1 Tax=Pseudomonas baltica TaxID=2762576 RepID=UPI00289F88B3|nr:sel1 repeat family protein [Pseudomonas baltica]
MQSKRLYALAIILMAWCSITFAGLTGAEQKSKKAGIELYNQYMPATNELTVAAQAGDSDAQYYLAEELRRKSQYITPESLAWYEASAAQGNIYAMIKLGDRDSDLCKDMQNCPPAKKTSQEWLIEANRLAKSRSDKGDAEAMYLMYRLSGDRDWLQKSAEHGFAQASYLMGIGDRQGEGFFLLPSKRAASVEAWMKASAEGQYPQGMMSYAAILAERGDIDGFNKWKEKAAGTGYASAVFDLACDLGHEPDKYSVPLDLVKSYGLLLLISELKGGGDIKENLGEVFPKVKAKMTSQQIDEGSKFAEHWKDSHPPLSFFPDKLDR